MTSNSNKLLALSLNTTRIFLTQFPICGNCCKSVYDIEERLPTRKEYSSCCITSSMLIAFPLILNCITLVTISHRYRLSSFLIKSFFDKNFKAHFLSSSFFILNCLRLLLLIIVGVFFLEVLFFSSFLMCTATVLVLLKMHYNIFNFVVA